MCVFLNQISRKYLFSDLYNFAQNPSQYKTFISLRINIIELGLFGSLGFTIFETMKKLITLNPKNPYKSREYPDNAKLGTEIT